MDFASAEELISFPKQVGIDVSEDYNDKSKSKTVSKAKLKVVKTQQSPAYSALDTRKKSISKEAIRASAPMLNVYSKSSLRTSKPSTPDRSVNK